MDTDVERDVDRERAGTGSGTPELIELFREVVALIGQHFETRCGQHDLTPPQAALLLRIDEPTAMRDVAHFLRCDASNVTGLTDRLETRGLVERRTRSDDRRVKELVLTDEGERVREQLRADLRDGHPVFERLDAEELRQLRSLFAKVVGR